MSRPINFQVVINMDSWLAERTYNEEVTVYRTNSVDEMRDLLLEFVERSWEFHYDEDDYVEATSVSLQLLDNYDNAVISWQDTIYDMLLEDAELSVLDEIELYLEMCESEDWEIW